MKSKKGSEARLQFINESHKLQDVIISFNMKNCEIIAPSVANSFVVHFTYYSRNELMLFPDVCNPVNTISQGSGLKLLRKSVRIFA